MQVKPHKLGRLLGQQKRQAARACAEVENAFAVERRDAFDGFEQIAVGVLVRNRPVVVVGAAGVDVDEVVGHFSEMR